MPRPSLRAAWIPCLLLPLLGCGGAEDTGAPARSSAPASAAQPPQRRGASPISVEDGRVWISVRGARRSEVLRELARQAPFELVAGALPADPVTLSADGAPLESVLMQLLEGADYRVEYRFDPRIGAHVVARVTAGDPGRGFAGELAARDRSAGPASEPTSPPEAAGPGRRSPLRNGLSRWQESSDEDLAAIQERRVRRATEEAGALERLYSRLAEQREAAVEEVDLEGPGRERVFELLADDPAPSVRAAALRRLVEEDSLQALDILYGALGDPASSVVLAAIETLEMVGDERSLPYLAPLVDGHPDPAVRQAAFEAVEFLE